jgi:hypothetical protein
MSNQRCSTTPIRGPAALGDGGLESVNKYATKRPIAAQAATDAGKTRSIVSVDCPDSYSDLARVPKAKNLTDEEVAEVLKLAEWARVELNYRPHAYQACALTT